MLIWPAGANLLWDSLESLLKWAASVWASGQHTVSRPGESVVRGEVGGSLARPPIMRPGIAPGQAAAAGVASCTRRAIRASRQWRLGGWQLAPANYLTRDSTLTGRGRRGCQPHPAGHPSQSSVARLAARARQLCDPG